MTQRKGFEWNITLIFICELARWIKYLDVLGGVGEGYRIGTGVVIISFKCINQKMFYIIYPFNICFCVSSITLSGKWCLFHINVSIDTWNGNNDLKKFFTFNLHLNLSKCRLISIKFHLIATYKVVLACIDLCACNLKTCTLNSKISL